MLAAFVILAAASASQTIQAQGAALAGMTFFECGQMKAAQPTRAAFTKEVRDLAATADPSVQFATYGVKLDDDEGHGCRVIFSGPATVVDPVADAMSKMHLDHSRISRTVAGDLVTITGVIVDPRP